MKTRDPKALPVAGLCLLLTLAGCGLDKVEVPDLSGPSELGLSVTLTASPDIVVADGFSTSLVRATVRDQNGRLAAGKPVFFTVTDSEGRFADIGSLRSTSGTGVGTGIQVATDSTGVAQVVYEAPPRTDATANQSILIAVRPVGTDFNGQIYRTVSIELRSAEPRLFPPGAAGTPNCNFIWEPSLGPYRVNQAILFQTTSSASANHVIVRYQWFFGDGTSEDSPDTAKVYRYVGTFTVTHVVTDNGGGQAACAATFTIVP